MYPLVASRVVDPKIASNLTRPHSAVLLQQGYLAHTKPRPLKTLQWDYA